MDQVAFARFVRRAVDNAKTTRGWTVSRLAAETGVGRSTLFRWLSCEGQDFPELASLRGFCAALDIPVATAFAALGVRESEFEEESEAREDMNLILLRLTDPTVPEAEKSVVRACCATWPGVRWPPASPPCSRRPGQVRARYRSRWRRPADPA